MMIKCIHDKCQWPECDKTCGMVPTGDYVVGSCAEEELIYHLQKELDRANASLAAVINHANAMINSLKSISVVPECGYEPTCPYGYVDCVYDPAYLREYNFDYWVECGMPTGCGESVCENGEWYDNEDK